MKIDSKVAKEKFLLVENFKKAKELKKQGKYDEALVHLEDAFISANLVNISNAILYIKKYQILIYTEQLALTEGSSNREKIKNKMREIIDGEPNPSNPYYMKIMNM